MRSTHSPTLLIRPESSSREMNAEGWHQAVLGTLPAQQHLDSNHSGGFQVPQRLIMQEEFLPLQPLAQTVFERDPLHDLLIQFCREEPELCPAVVFGLVHCRIGAPEQG